MEDMVTIKTICFKKALSNGFGIYSIPYYKIKIFKVVPKLRFGNSLILQPISIKSLFFEFLSKIFQVYKCIFERLENYTGVWLCFHKLFAYPRIYLRELQFPAIKAFYFFYNIVAK
jgi:hypothetical protein